MSVPDPTPIYHLTHVDNLGSVIQCGGLLSHNAKLQRGIGHRNIAHDTIQDRRARTRVRCGPQGVLHDYVPFFFGPRPPMLYSISTGFVEGYAEGQEPLIYLVTTAQAVGKSSCRWVFTDGHATMAFTDFYDDLRDLDKVDWQVMRSRYWYDTPEQPDRKRRRQAEFLIRDLCPWDLIAEIGVMTADVRERVNTILASVDQRPLVTVRRAWYY